MYFNFGDPGVQSALIGAAASVLSAVVAASCAAVIGKQISGRKKLQALLQASVEDIQFLLAVEDEHCSLHKLMSDETYKQRVRQLARDRGLTWSGRFTPGRVRSSDLLKLESRM